MRMLLLGLLLVLAPWVAVSSPAAAETCFLSGERVDGQNKICYYDCPSGGAAITVLAYKLCPLRITR